MCIVCIVYKYGMCEIQYTCTVHSTAMLYRVYVCAIVRVCAQYSVHTHVCMNKSAMLLSKTQAQRNLYPRDSSICV